MCSFLARHVRGFSSVRTFSTAHTLRQNNIQCKLLVVGGGSGGCAVAAKFARKLARHEVVVVEPSESHYYQPMWTLVGGGIKTVRQSCRPMKQVLPSRALWVQDKVSTFLPAENRVVTAAGKHISYEYMVVALGIVVDWSKIKNLPEALNCPGVSSNYLPYSAEKTFENMQNFRQGNALFTFPSGTIKCPGAPQKIAYIADDYFRKTGKRDKAKIIYNTALPVIFGVERYARALTKMVQQRNIEVNTRRNLIEIRPDSREAVFQDLDQPDRTFTQQYEMLHVAPPMKAPEELASGGDLVDSAGFVDVDSATIQHRVYSNVFAIGDCTSLPTSKTAAAVAGECGVVEKNLWAVMNNRRPRAVYDGYTSCPLITSYSSAILAEFCYNGRPLETLPLRQDRELRLSMVLKRDLMPHLYWQLHLRGLWNGPALVRKLLHLGKSE